MNLDFSVEVDIEIDSDSKKPKGFSYESYGSKASLNYQLVIETRSWGIKSFCFLVPTQEILFSVELEAEGKDEPSSYNFKVKIDNIEMEDPSNHADKFKPYALCLILDNIIKLDDNTFGATATGELTF